MPGSARDPLARLVLGGLAVTVEDHAGDLLLILDDGMVSVWLEQGRGSRMARAIAGLERLAVAASALAEQLREIGDAHA